MAQHIALGKLPSTPAHRPVTVQGFTMQATRSARTDDGRFSMMRASDYLNAATSKGPLLRATKNRERLVLEHGLQSFAISLLVACAALTNLAASTLPTGWQEYTDEATGMPSTRQTGAHLLLGACMHACSYARKRVHVRVYQRLMLQVRLTTTMKRAGSRSGIGLRPRPLIQRVEKQRSPLLPPPLLPLVVRVQPPSPNACL